LFQKKVVRVSQFLFPFSTSPIFGIATSASSRVEGEYRTRGLRFKSCNVDGTSNRIRETVKGAAHPDCFSHPSPALAESSYLHAIVCVEE
jgi:hypothetical protein